MNIVRGFVPDEGLHSRAPPIALAVPLTVLPVMIVFLECAWVNGQGSGQGFNFAISLHLTPSITYGPRLSVPVYWPRVPKKIAPPPSLSRAFVTLF